MIVWEIKKLIKSKSTMVVSIIFILLCMLMSFVNPVLETENSYIDKNNNYIVDERDGLVIGNEKLYKKINELRNLQEMKDNKETDYFSKNISHMADEKLIKDEGKEYKDISFYKVFNYRISNIIVSIIIVGIIVAVFSNIYTDEKLSNVDSVILSSKNKYKVLYSKLGLSILTPIVIWGLYLLVIGVVTSIQYGVPVNGDLQAYRIIDSITVLRGAYTINQYTLINILTMLLIFVSISIFASLFSFITSNSVESVIAITVFVVLAKVLSIVKILPKKLITILSTSNYIDIFQNPQMFIGAYIGNIDILGKSVDIINLGYVSLIIVLLIGLFSNVFVIKKVLNK